MRWLRKASCLLLLLLLPATAFRPVVLDRSRSAPVSSSSSSSSNDDGVEDALDFDIQSRINVALRAVDQLQGTSYAARYADEKSDNSASSSSSSSFSSSPAATPPPRASAHPSAMETRGSARLFLDTADVALWEEHLPLGLYHGVTTNPVLLERAGVECSISSVAGLASAALEGYGLREFMVQAWGDTAEELVRCGAALAALDAANQDRIVVKLPLTREGIAAAKILGQGTGLSGGGMGARLCMTTCYNKEQAFVAAALGAEYVAPYLGRMSEAPSSKALLLDPATTDRVDGVAECAAMARVIRGMGSSTRVLVASLRSAEQLTALAAAGCDTFTFSPAIADELLCEPLTTAAAADFQRAAVAMGAKPVP